MGLYINDNMAYCMPVNIGGLIVRRIDHKEGYIVTQ